MASRALTFLALYVGLIPAEEELFSQKFKDQYETADTSHACFHETQGRGHVVKTPFDWRAACGEWRFSLILAVILGVFRTIAALSGPSVGNERKNLTSPLACGIFGLRLESERSTYMDRSGSYKQAMQTADPSE